MKTLPITLYVKPARTGFTDAEWDSLAVGTMPGEVGVEFPERGAIFGLVSRGLMSFMSYRADDLIADIKSGKFIENDFFYFDAGNTRPGLAAKTEDIVEAFKEFGLV